MLKMSFHFLASLKTLEANANFCSNGVGCIDFKKLLNG